MTATATTTGWTKATTDLPGIDYEGEAKFALRLGPAWLVVRPTTCGHFAVLDCSGGRHRIAKVLPTAERARAYMWAMAR